MTRLRALTHFLEKPRTILNQTPQAGQPGVRPHSPTTRPCSGERLHNKWELHIRWGRRPLSPPFLLYLLIRPLAISSSTSSSSPLPTPAAPLSLSSEFKRFARQFTHKATPAKSLFQLRVLPPPAAFPFRYSYYSRLRLPLPLSSALGP
jgi:hypothetical protein